MNIVWNLFLKLISYSQRKKETRGLIFLVLKIFLPLEALLAPHFWLGSALWAPTQVQVQPRRGRCVYVRHCYLPGLWWVRFLAQQGLHFPWLLGASHTQPRASPRWLGFGLEAFSWALPSLSNGGNGRGSVIKETLSGKDQVMGKGWRVSCNRIWRGRDVG